MKYDHSNFNAQRAYSGAANDRIANFLPMVRKLAWYYEGSCGASLDIDDLLQAGMIALTESAQRHDRPGEDGFAAYAKMRVRGAMIDLLRTQSPHARGAAGQRRRIEAATDRLRTRLGQEPSAAEIAAEMQISVGEYHDMRTQLATRVVDLEDCYSDSNPMFESSEPDEAEDAYLRALKVDSCHPDAHLNLGRLFHEKGRLEQAEAHYRQAMQFKPLSGVSLKWPSTMVPA